jgi:glucosamine-6-phosphate deaminase
MSIKVIVTSDFDHMSEVAAAIAIENMQQTLSKKPSFVLGLATGNSPTGLYKHLAKAANTGKIDSSKMISFNLDEYIGLPGENAQQRALHKESYSFFMIQEYFGLLRDKFKEVNVPWGTLIDQSVFKAELQANPDDWKLQGTEKGKAVVIKRNAKSEYLRWIRREILDGYAKKIAKRGGIDLHIIGVGGRGHVGFHEAGVPFEGNQVILIKMDDNTISNAVTDGHFSSKNECPLYAISMGAELVYKAKTVLLVANGKRKAQALADALLMEPHCSVPISYGHNLAKKRGRMIFVIDRLAAALVLEKADQIRRRGIELEDRSLQRASVSVASLQFFRNPETGLMS